ncbi:MULTISPECIES: hypothetical protein [unclassified Roseivivax]|uniref:hypothetical protein n=1 Tax=Roseivivax sp. GX 12232 TaxID=2900547 RepID=UPI001E2DDC2E|nr:hypothetical protein [Roseivivax sp. GX 12232]MCE0504473.1 hypothetical protein [Roseivivax sp. GX 12232]
MRKRFPRLPALPVLAALALAACAEPQSNAASPEEITRAAYRHDGPPALTLYTMVSNNSGAGAHTSLMINGSQRVIFDPAGSVKHPQIPEKGDVLYGITPEVARFYESAHARETYHVVVQRVEVSPEVAERALRLAMANGAVGPMFCTSETAGILRQLPGFESISPVLFPKRLAEQFGAVPGVETRAVYESDADDKTEAVEAFRKSGGA